jgi:hypothetical protein
VTSADITWKPAPADWPEDADPIERIVDLTIERDAYRKLAQQALHALRLVTAERDRLREYRRLDRQQRAA